MEHLVKFTTAEGREGQHSADSLDDALRFVERLRNTEEVSAVRVFRVQEVPIEFKTYYKVELRAGESAGEGSEGEQPAAESPEPSPEGGQPTAEAPAAEGETPSANGPERRLFARG